jgi:hypothetical protein
MLFDDEIWPLVPDHDLWIFDKLILSRRLGHLCGPSGVPVPVPGHYIVRPCVNLNGMGRGASVQWIEKETDFLPPGTFWQERFVGRHLSVDYLTGQQIRCSEGIRYTDDLTRFHKWILVNDVPSIPQLVLDIISKYSVVNIEMIDGKVIEIHLRGNPDFDDGAIELIPIWVDDTVTCPDGFVFVEDKSYDRIGFFKKY